MRLCPLSLHAIFIKLLYHNIGQSNNRILLLYKVYIYYPSPIKAAARSLPRSAQTRVFLYDDRLCQSPVLTRLTAGVRCLGPSSHFLRASNPMQMLKAVSAGARVLKLFADAGFRPL